MTGINLLLTFIVSQFSLLSVQPLSVHLLSLFYDLRLTTRRLGWVTAEPSTLRYEPLLLGSSNTAPGPISWEASELGMQHGITMEPTARASRVLDHGSWIPAAWGAKPLHTHSVKWEHLRYNKPPSIALAMPVVRSSRVPAN